MTDIRRIAEKYGLPDMRGKMPQKPVPAKKPKCERCNGYKFVTHHTTDVDHPEFGRAIRCPLCGYKDENLDKLWGASGLAPLQRDFKPDYLQGRNNVAVAVANKLIGELHGVFVFWGPVGTGKSGLAQSVVSAAIRKGYRSHYTLLSDMMTAIKATYDPDYAGNELQMLDRYRSFKVLVIDEPDRVNQTGWSNEKFMQILTWRYERREAFCTIICTNEKGTRDENGLRQFVSNSNPNLEFIDDRLREAVTVPFLGKSMRGKQ